jgi:hypothetical protein
MCVGEEFNISYRLMEISRSFVRSSRSGGDHKPMRLIPVGSMKKVKITRDLITIIDINNIYNL